MRLLHVPQQYFKNHLIGKNLENATFSFKCFVCENTNKITVINVDDWLYCECKHEYLAQDFFDDEQLFTLRLASTSQLVNLLRLVRVTFNGEKQDRVCQKIGGLLGLDGDWRTILGYVDRNHKEEVQQSKNRQNLRFIF